jgi:hypothetical protein
MTEPYRRKEVIGDATRRTIIYALCEPLPNWQTGPVRYVGKTDRMPADRLKANGRIGLRNPRLPIHWWMRKNLLAGHPHHIIWLESVPAGADWAARERYWISHYRDAGADLLNLTQGGEGLVGHRFTDDHKSKIAQALRTGGSFECQVCGAGFWRKKNEIAKGHNKFCSRDCSNRRHA